ncbi:signal transduction histidine kinase [Paucibacter oligotrophus]|uniref:histidine kinase n=1 Tax=Roseateles oligotrophus TaxID=1769250 RepID=A0A840LEG0_9BURK|nr:ATP-binding protein [Roseateles oligotrophus]MBB4844449.1 signal transduction histidine kinase [Roseateles oligotrophus]
MQISTKVKLATTVALLTVGAIALMIWRADIEVDEAQAQRHQVGEISHALSDLRLVTFEYILHRQERARQQEAQVAQRLARSLEVASFPSTEAAECLAALRKRSETTHQLFAELGPARQDLQDGLVGSDLTRRFEAQLASRLLIGQQESVMDAMRLGDFATERINQAQERVVLVIAIGLSLLAGLALAAAWLISRGLLLPLSQLEQATREVAEGNWDYQLKISAHNEVGRMAAYFDAMTRALRESFGRVERSNHELAALNREMEAFSYSVSHDLRGPLRSMDGFSLALLEDYGEKFDAEGRDYLQRIRAASQRMGRLIDELLGLSRVTRAELSLRKVSLSEIAQEIADSLSQQEPQRQVRWEIEDGICLHADRALIQIAMQNLLQNAWKFTGKAAQALIRVGVRQQAEGMVCYVADNGVGFDMNYADRLFGAFQRLHHENDFAGTGIGLAIVQRIFARHGGRIWAQARPGLGATFFFTLTTAVDAHNGQEHLAG